MGGGLWGELATNQHCIQGDVTEIWMNLLTLILPLMNVRKLFLPKMSNMKLKEDCALFFQVQLPNFSSLASVCLQRIIFQIFIAISPYVISTLSLKLGGGNRQFVSA